MTLTAYIIGTAVCIMLSCGTIAAFNTKNPPTFDMFWEDVFPWICMSFIWPIVAGFISIALALTAIALALTIIGGVFIAFFYFVWVGVHFLVTQTSDIISSCVKQDD